MSRGVMVLRSTAVRGRYGGAIEGRVRCDEAGMSEAPGIDRAASASAQNGSTEKDDGWTPRG